MSSYNLSNSPLYVKGKEDKILIIDPDLADDQVIYRCYYDKTTKNLLSFCLKKIKFWNLLPGKVCSIYDELQVCLFSFFHNT